MLSDRIVLVTNVCHFVGLPIAEQMAASGAIVHCHDVSFTEDAAASAFAAAHPQLHVATAQQPAELVEAITAAHGRLDVLVNNDAYPAIRAAVETADAADLRAGLEALLVFPFLVSQAVVPQMKARAAGKILFITSAAPLRGIPNYSMYAAARGGTNALAVCLARELASANIQVNAIAPNFVESPTYFPPQLLADPEALRKITANIPLGRLGRPEEVAAAACYLAGPGSNFITGHVLPVAGGWA